MNYCKTCRHWNYDPKDQMSFKVSAYCDPTDPDTYKSMEMPFLVRECRHPAKTFCERPVEINGFGLADGSEYMAVLFTGEEFGCVRHEATDQA